MFGFQVKIYSGQDKVELVRANNLTGNGYRKEHRSKIILTRSGFNILLHFAPPPPGGGVSLSAEHPGPPWHSI